MKYFLTEAKEVKFEFIGAVLPSNLNYLVKDSFEVLFVHSHMKYQLWQRQDDISQFAQIKKQNSQDKRPIIKDVTLLGGERPSIATQQDCKEEAGRNRQKLWEGVL